VEIARQAGRLVLKVYQGNPKVSYKDDRSPLTEADRASHSHITEGLQGLAPHIPVLSEEGASVPYQERKGWKEFFLVDPLDGTKEFISRNGEFTVNICLMREGIPTLAVVHAPALGLSYWALKGHGAFRQEGQKVQRLHSRTAPRDGLAVVVSRSHPSRKLEAFLKPLTVRQQIPRGSSLKFCLLAEGSADLYPRLGPTWEWDTAAGHCILQEAGGLVVDPRGKPLGYNKEDLKHQGFIAMGSPQLLEVLGLAG